MGIFNFKKNDHYSENSKELLKDIKNTLQNFSLMPDPISNEEYQKIRKFEVQWLEEHYDFNTIAGIDSIPVTKELERPPTTGVTGEVYYYLRRKAFDHEKNGDIDLAIECLKKSNELMKLRYGANIKKSEYYYLVRFLARSGKEEEAYTEKSKIDHYYEIETTNEEIRAFNEICRSAREMGTDLIIMSVHSASCPECAKYQGRVFSISGKSKKFPKVPDSILEKGCVHSGCGHTFYPYIYKVSDPNLSYTLSVHPLKNKRYGKNIIAFSNRPFEDDRTDEYVAAAKEAQLKLKQMQQTEEQNNATLIQHEINQRKTLEDYNWISNNIPEKCPKSVTGYRRMRATNSKNFITLKKLAAEKGRILS